MFKPLALRLLPGQDLKNELDRLIEKKNIAAACVVTCVGSLTRAVLRFANQELATEMNGHFEIVSLTGTLSKHGSHCHISLSDEHGRTYGAHLLEGCEIYTTAEIVIGVLPNLRFSRSLDTRTGFPELEITYLPKP